MEGVKGTTVKSLLVELYDKAGQLKQWWLVRHTAGTYEREGQGSKGDGVRGDRGWGGVKGTTVKSVLVELYDKAGQLKQWWLVRHTAGTYGS